MINQIICGECIEIKEHPIYKGYFADKDGKVYSNKKFTRNPNGEIKEIKGCKNKKGYIYSLIRFEGRNIGIMFHRLVFECITNKVYEWDAKTSDGLTINHINENKSDNSFDNLEILSNRDNIRKQLRFQNRKLPMYVYYDKRQKSKSKPYVVQKLENKKMKSYGSYKTLEEAKKVADVLN